MSLRRHLISKLFAIWFVVLIVLPFTAPFKTISLRKIHHKTHQIPAHRGISSVAKSDKKITPEMVIRHTIPLVTGLPLEVHGIPSESLCRTAPTVLRV